MFGLPEVKKKMHDGYTVETAGFQSSKVFHLPESGCSFFKQDRFKEPCEQQETIYHRINMQNVQGYKFYEIDEIQYNELPYEVVSKSPYLSVRIPRYN